MELVSLLGTALAVVVLLNLAIRIFKIWKFRSTINKIPGIKAPPFLGVSLTTSQINVEDRLQLLKKISDSFNEGIFRLWVGPIATVFIRKPKHIETILPSTALITKSLSYKYIIVWLGEGLVTSTGTKWFHDRKMITPSFHFNVLQEFTEIMHEKAVIYNECLADEFKRNPTEPVDIFSFSVRCTMDIICETAMGINLNCQRERNNAYSQALHRFSLLTMSRIFSRWLMWDWIYYKTAEGKESLKAVHVMHELSRKVIRQKQEERKKKMMNSDQEIDDFEDGRRKRKALLDLLLDANEHDKQPLSDQEVREHVDTFIFAGHDTTAAAISWALFLVGHHPEVQEKISQELDEVLGNSTHSPTSKELANLNYLEMVMKETLRLYPSVPQISRAVTEDIKLGGYKIPKGSFIAIGIFFLHRDPDVWPDPDKFDPERFTPERSIGRHPYAYLPFSAGPRNCIGQKFAMLEFKIVLATVLRKWKIRSARSIEDMKLVRTMVLAPHNGIPMYLTPK